ncbi:threonine synthase [Laceyella putida]|uniref:Pyridoxal-phosphate dependent enzyme n=1 Tax=Laceyella putida TaxID=110101 RepID=A0ABW2RNS0_9BACL
MYELNPNINHLVCLRCESIFNLYEQIDHNGCPKCFQDGTPSNITFKYKEQKLELNEHERGLFRYHTLLPYLSFPTLGEADTPLICLDNLAKELGIQSLWLKNEGQNPTGSHKDRMSPLVVAHAISTKKIGVIVSSTGNAGASIATYAARGGVKCVIFTSPNINPIWKQAMEKTGSKLVYDKTYIAELINSKEWFPATDFFHAVGSNPFGLQGYKTISYEIIEKKKDDMPSKILIPSSSRGDLLWGIWQGFMEAQEMGYIAKIPKLIAVEPFPRLKKVLDGANYLNFFEGETVRTPSLSGTRVTYQAIKAIQYFDNDAISPPNDEVELEQEHLAKHGIYVERSSAITLGALKQLIKEKKVTEEDKILIINTSNGYRVCLINMSAAPKPFSHSLHLSFGTHREKVFPPPPINQLDLPDMP